METMTVAIGIERVRSDDDALSQDGFETILRDAALGYGDIPRQAVTIESCFERVWSDTDELQNMQFPRILKQAV
jgi:hypothetical protein